MDSKKKVSLMIAVIMLLQIILPIITVVLETEITLISRAEGEIQSTDFQYTVNGNEIIITGCREDATEVIIPSTIDGKSVTGIDYDAFCDCDNLTTVSIPSSVTDIGMGGMDTFTFCMSLTCINVDPENQNYASDNGVLFNKDKTKIICYPAKKTGQEYIIPSSVTYIKYSAFKNCSSLTSIEIPDSVTYMGDYAFEGCSSLESIEIPSSVEYMGCVLFADCSSLTSVEIPNSVVNIGPSVFANCSSLTSINVDPENQNYVSDNGVLFNKEKTELICYPAGKTEQEYIIPSSVTSIGVAAFFRCSSLTSIKIPEGVTSIGYSAFYGCSSLTSIEIPNSVTSIESDTFSGCSSLESIEIPSSVTEIEEKVFKGCSSLTSVEIPNSVVRIGPSVFEGCSSLTSIEIPSSVTEIEEKVFKGCSSLTSVEIPNSVVRIGSSVFEGCSSLTSIEIPNSIISIGSRVFSSCNSLTSINVDPNNENYISTNGVLFDKNKTEIICYPARKIEQTYIIPDSVISVGKYAFEGCSRLTSIETSTSITSIGEYAFKDCSNLTSIEIPSSVISIEQGTFMECSNLTSIEIPSGVTRIGFGTFTGCSNLRSIVIPRSVRIIGSNEFSSCSSLIIYCEEGSYARHYAVSENIPYKHIPLSIAVKTGPSKTSYYVGESLNIEGLVLIATYDDGTTEEISEELKYTPSILNTAGTQTITVKYRGKTTTFNVTVVLKGDANGDSNVDFKDILAINKHRLNKESLIETNLKAADVTGDGEVTFADILQINKYRLGKINSL